MKTDTNLFDHKGTSKFFQQLFQSNFTKSTRSGPFSVWVPKESKLFSLALHTSDIDLCTSHPERSLSRNNTVEISVVHNKETTFNVEMASLKPFTTQHLADRLAHIVCFTKFTDYKGTWGRYILDFSVMPSALIKSLFDHVLLTLGTNPRVNKSWIIPLQNLLIKSNLKKSKSRKHSKNKLTVAPVVNDSEESDGFPTPSEDVIELLNESPQTVKLSDLSSYEQEILNLNLNELKAALPYMNENASRHLLSSLSYKAAKAKSRATLANRSNLLDVYKQIHSNIIDIENEHRANIRSGKPKSKPMLYNSFPDQAEIKYTSSYGTSGEIKPSKSGLLGTIQQLESDAIQKIMKG